jgi:hypothetical protein
MNTMADRNLIVTLTANTVPLVHDSILATDPEGETRSYYADHYPYTLPENAMEFDSIAAMKRAVEASGSHYFDADAVRFFRGRTGRNLYARRFWVESRQFVDSNGEADLREYQVAWVSRYENGANVSLSIEKAGHFLTSEFARDAAQVLGRAVAGSL